MLCFTCDRSLKERERDSRPWWNVADGRLDVVRDPLDEVAAVLVLYIQHLLVDLTHRHLTTEDRCHGQVSSVSRVAGGHHVLSVEHLLRQLGYAQSPVRLAATRRQRSEARHEEVKARERYHVHGKFAQVGVQLKHVTTKLLRSHRSFCRIVLLNM